MHPICRATLLSLSAAALALAAACSDPDGGAAEGPCPEGLILVGETCAWPNPNGDAQAGYDGSFGGNPGGKDAFGSKDGGLADAGADAEDTKVWHDTTVINPNDVPEQDTAPCDEGKRRCFDSATIEVCQQGVWMVELKCPGGLQCKEALCVEILACTAGEIQGCFTETAIRQCDEEGKSFVQVPCPEGQWCYQGKCGDQKCGDNEKVCLTLEQVGQCAADGKSYEFYEDCGEGAVCVGGKCLSGCEALVKYNKSYIGCEYWATDLDQYDESAIGGLIPGMKNPPDAPWGIVISNPGKIETAVTFKSNDPAIQAELDKIVNKTVPAGNAKQFVLPTINVDLTSLSQKSIQVLTDRPVFVHQFNPLNNEDVASNDASLLLPVHALGDEYYITTQPSSPTTDIGIHFEGQRSYFTVMAVMKGETKVTAKVTCDTLAGEGIPAMKGGEEKTFTLQQWDVLNIEADAKISFPPKPEQMGDLTGTHVYSDKPIVVFSGHEESVIAPDDTKDSCCAEHLEEQMFPVESWRDHVLAVKTKPRGGEPDVWRVVGGADGVKIATNPKIQGLDGQTLGKGKWVEAITPQSFEIKATGPILVAQYTVSNNQTDDWTGDPSLIQAVPTAQFRDEYTIMVPLNYKSNYATVIRPAGAPIELDAAPIPDSSFQSFGSGSHEYAYLSLSEGVHYLKSTEKFGVSQYGWSSVVSYGCPGGLDLSGE